MRWALSGMRAAAIPDGLLVYTSLTCEQISCWGCFWKTNFYKLSLLSFNYKNPKARWLIQVWKTKTLWLIKLLVIWANKYPDSYMWSLCDNNQCLFSLWWLKKVSNTEDRKQTVSQDNTQEALAYFCHFLSKQSILGNLQQTQAWSHSRTGNALILWRQ